MKTPEEVVRHVELTVRRLNSMQRPHPPGFLETLSVASIEYHVDHEVIMFQAAVLGEKLDHATLTYPRDWKSGCWDALAKWLTHVDHTGLPLWVWARPRLRRVVLALRDHARARVVLTTHTWEVRREWLDQVYEGHPTRVIAYLDGQSIPGTEPEFDRFEDKFYTLKSVAGGRDPRAFDAAVAKLLEAAERTNWRKAFNR